MIIIIVIFIVIVIIVVIIVMTWPVGLPGLMTTRARTSHFSLAAVMDRSSSATSIAQLRDSSR